MKHTSGSFAAGMAAHATQKQDPWMKGPVACWECERIAASFTEFAGLEYLASSIPSFFSDLLAAGAMDITAKEFGITKAPT